MAGICDSLPCPHKPSAILKTISGLLFLSLTYASSLASIITTSCLFDRAACIASLVSSSSHSAKKSGGRPSSGFCPLSSVLCFFILYVTPTLIYCYASALDFGYCQVLLSLP